MKAKTGDVHSWSYFWKMEAFFGPYVWFMMTILPPEFSHISLGRAAVLGLIWTVGFVACSALHLAISGRNNVLGLTFVMAGPFICSCNPSAVTLPLGVLVRTQFFVLFYMALMVALYAMFLRWSLRRKRKWKDSPISPLADLEIDSRPR